jgi:hypothetical protein
MSQCKSRIGPSVRNCAALTRSMGDVATARGSKRSSRLPSGLGAPGSAGAATRATSTGRSVSIPYGIPFRFHNPGSCTPSRGARDSNVMRQTGCRLCGSPWADACGSRGTGCGKPARPDVRPAKADAFSGSQSRQGKSQSLVAWMAGRRETECLKPIDNVIFGMAASHRAAAQANIAVAPKVRHPGGRARIRRAKAA